MFLCLVCSLFHDTQNYLYSAANPHLKNVVPGTFPEVKIWLENVHSERIYIQRFASHFDDFSKIADLQYKAYNAPRYELLDLLFLKNRENVAQIFEYIFSWSERFQFKSLLLVPGTTYCQMWVGGQIHVILWVVDVSTHITLRNFKTCSSLTPKSHALVPRAVHWALSGAYIVGY